MQQWYFRHRDDDWCSALLDDQGISVRSLRTLRRANRGRRITIETRWHWRLPSFTDCLTLPQFECYRYRFVWAVTGGYRRYLGVIVQPMEWDDAPQGIRDRHAVIHRKAARAALDVLDQP